MYNVKNFTYNGFFGKLLGGETSYTAEFEEWTTDPGVAKCRCSDGEERLIPTFALVGLVRKELPKQIETGVLFGAPSQS